MGSIIDDLKYFKQETQPSFPQTPSQVASKTLNDWYLRGYSLWACAVMGGEVIMVVEDQRPRGSPEGYPVYTTEELVKIEPLPASTVRLINTAKKLADAEVLSVRKRSDNA